MHLFPIQTACPPIRSVRRTGVNHVSGSKPGARGGDVQNAD